MAVNNCIFKLARIDDDCLYVFTINNYLDEIEKF